MAFKRGATDRRLLAAQHLTDDLVAVVLPDFTKVAITAVAVLLRRERLVD